MPITVPLLIAAAYWACLLLPLAGGNRSTQPRGTPVVLVRPTIVRGSDPESVASAQSARRAVVCLTSISSVPAKISEMRFEQAAARLTTWHARVGVRYFALEEGAPAVQAWVATLGPPVGEASAAKGGFSLAWGSLIWLERGRVIGYAGPEEQAPVDDLAEDIVGRCLLLWGQSAGN